MTGPERLGFLSEIELDAAVRDSLARDMSDASTAPANEVAGRIRDDYGIELAGKYAGLPIPHPFGKAAGQLSLHKGHVSSDRRGGLSFTVLKSAVGVTAEGDVGITEWERSAPKMVVERRRARDGRDGWTVSWKGRGWIKGFDAYVDLYRDSLRENPAYTVIPSIMVDVTDSDRARDQAHYCLERLIEVHRISDRPDRFLIEIDISPTLFLLPDSSDDDSVRGWVISSVAAFRSALGEAGQCIVKIPNADRGAEFQTTLIRDALEEGGRAIAGVLVGNRLFDPGATFEGQTGIAYGGYDLSNANLEALDRLAEEKIETELIGTGNICSGRMMAEYALRSCSAGEIHTFFQLPHSAYRAPSAFGPRVWRALRELIFHPDDGLITTLLGLEAAGKLQRVEGHLRFLDLPSAC